MFLLHVNIKDAQKKMTEEELRTIVDVSQENGVIEHEERDMIHNLFDFGDAEAKEIMVPRIDMTFVQADATYQEVLDIFRQDMFTRLPVYEDSTDNVIGIINMKDFLLQNDTPEFSVRNLLREPYFTYEHKNTADLFLEMRKSSISLAIVLDEYGAKDMIYKNFHQSLKSHGVLFIGSTEQITNYKELGFDRLSSFYFEKNV